MLEFFTFGCLINVKIVVEGKLVRIEFLHHMSYVVEQRLFLIVRGPSVRQLWWSRR